MGRMALDKEISWLLDEKYGGTRPPEAEGDIERLRAGEPLAYVIGFVDFLGSKIDLSQRTLIPRPETEFWVEKQFTTIYRSKLERPKCLDIFAGSGCIGISLLKKIPGSTVDFADIDDRAIRQIEINCKLNGIEKNRYRIIKSDIFENIHDSYDFIFANPPYIAEDKISDVEKSVLDHEPHQALFAGPDGLLFIKKFLDQAQTYLSHGVNLYMEFDSHQKEVLEKMYPNAKFYQDQFKQWRYLVLEKR